MIMKIGISFAIISLSSLPVLLLREMRQLSESANLGPATKRLALLLLSYVLFLEIAPARNGAAAVRMEPVLTRSASFNLHFLIK